VHGDDRDLLTRELRGRWQRDHLLEAPPKRLFCLGLGRGAQADAGDQFVQVGHVLPSPGDSTPRTT